MPQSDIIANGQLVNRMSYAVADGEKSIKHVPLLIEQVIDTEAWRHRLVSKLPVKHERFIDFIKTPPVQGMGWSTKEDIEQVESLLRYSPDVLRKWREAMKLPAGTNQYTMVRNNITDHEPVKRGTSLAYTLDRLERERPDLYAKVIAKEMSANAAAIEAGFRKPPVRRCPQCGHEW